MSNNIQNSHHVVVIVLGDVGRSPRMQYHTSSLLQNNYRVTLIGYEGEDLIPSLQAKGGTTEPKLNVIRFTPYSNLSLPRMLGLALKLLSLLYHLFHILWNLSFDCILVQNPPSIPLLSLSLFYPCVIIDWHNLGYTMFDTKLLRHVCYYYEQWFCRYGRGHFTVTAAMKSWLTTKFLIGSSNCGDAGEVVILRDCPAEFFHRTTDVEREELLTRLDSETVLPSKTVLQLRDTTSKTKSMLCISSTSYTPEEDFGILLSSLVKIDFKLSQSTSNASFSNLVVIVTGKGPLKQYYADQISALRLSHVQIHQVWLSASDYPLLLGMADVGISLHTSTSGIDLPMKVLDMFGCEVPVISVFYDTIHELVVKDENGWVVKDTEELTHCLKNLLMIQKGGKCRDAVLESMRANIRKNILSKRWNENWNEAALPLIQSVCLKCAKH